jgi:hypothetical protein
MENLSPNSQNLNKCILYFLSCGHEMVNKERLKNKPYDFSDQSIYELIRKNIIEEDSETVWLVKK